MWSHRRLPRPRTLAGQFLALQVVLLLLVVAVTSVVSFRQSDADFRDSRGARLRAAAENLASTAAVQEGMAADSQSGPSRSTPSSARTTSGRPLST